MARVLLIATALVLMTLGFGTVSALVWQNETVDRSSGSGQYTSLALDADGNPCISYLDRNGNLKYGWDDGMGWNTEIVDAARDVGQYSSLALDTDGNPRISYWDWGNNDLKYAWHDSTGWHSQTVDSNGSYIGRYTSLALNSEGYPRISYYDGVDLDDGGNKDLKYAWFDGASWHIEIVDAEGDVGEYTSLALDAAGNPHISYYDRGSNNHLKYAWHDGTIWRNETVDFTDFVGHDTSLALDSAGNPRISYLDSWNKDLKYAWRDSAGWHTETVDNGSIFYDTYTSLALDAAGNPRISYCDSSGYLGTHRMKYAWRDIAGWQNETVDAAENVGSYSSLALDAAGNPRISYYDRCWGKLKYAWANASLPVVVTVPGGSALPTDTNADGKYEDVNGNGRKDFADVVLYFNQMTWIAANEPLSAFDYNGNGRIDFADVTWLFQHL